MPSVFTTVRKADSTPLYPGKILYRPTDAPRGYTGGVVGGEDILVETSPDGFCSELLLPGTYYVWVGPKSRRRRITVPDVGDSQLLEDLLGISGAGDLPLNYRLTGLSLQLIHAETGEFHPVRWAGPAGEPHLEIGSSAGTYDIASYLFATNQALQLWHPEASAWVSPYISGPAEAPALTAGSAGTAVIPSARRLGGKLQLYNVTTAAWHTVFLQASPPHFAIGVAS